MRSSQQFRHLFEASYLAVALYRFGMKIIAVLVFLLSSWCLAQTVLPDRFPLFSTEATVAETVLAPDGGAFIRGDFHAIDGIPRPGLAKLRADGSLDLEFAPLDQPGSLFVDQFGEPIYDFAYAPWYSGSPPTLFPLSNGNLIWSDFYGHWLRGPDGQLIPNSFAGFDLGIEEEPEPQFERAGEVCLVIRRTNTPNEIAFADPADGSHLRTLTLPEDLSIYQTLTVAPAADGKLWVLAASRPHYTSSGRLGSITLHLVTRLYRLLPGGELDPDFPQTTLLPNRFCTIESATPSQIVLSYAPRVSSGWPYSSPVSRFFEFRNAQGELISDVSVGLNSPESFTYALSGETVHILRSHPLQIFTGSSLEPTSFFEGDSSAFPNGIHSLNALPDGSFLIGGTRKITPQGELDPGHHIARATTTTAIFDLISLPQNRVLVRGSFDQVSGAEHSGAVVLNADQSLDPTFKTEIDFRQVISVLAKPNGHLLVTVASSRTDAQGDTSRLLELDQRGRLLDVIPLNFANNSSAADGSLPPLDDTDPFTVTLRPVNGLLMNVTNNNSPAPILSSWFLPNGDPSAATKIRTSNSPTHESADSRSLSQVAYLGEGLIHSEGMIYQLSGNLAHSPQPLPQGTSFTGLFPDGSLLIGDRRWHPGTGFHDESLPFLWDLEFYFPEFIPAQNGKLFLTSNNLSPQISNGFLFSGFLPRSPAVLRLHSSLQVDPSFTLDIGKDGLVGDLLPVGDAVWVSGDFSEINGVQRASLARISDDQAGGFQDWMRAVTRVPPTAPVTFDPLADSDHDGSSDFYEYALGSHPITPSATDPRLQKLSATTYRLPCNPDAPEVLRQLEVSTDLETWRPALASEVSLATTRSCLTWTLRPGFHHLFCRVKIIGPE